MIWLITGSVDEGMTMTCCVPTWDWHDAEVTMDQVRSDAGEWRFSVHWQCFRAKGRSPYSPFFTTAQLAQFEVVDYESDRARLTEVKTNTRPRQLCLPLMPNNFDGVSAFDQTRMVLEDP
jgi:hypothetical protein